jgi:ribonuclease J
MAAMSRIAIDDHRYVKLGPDDTVVLSARSIPGNEKAIGRVMNHIARRGAEVVYEGIKHVHVSGHGSEEELKLVLSLVKPRYFVPVHGEYRQLAQHARIAARVFAGREPRPEVLLAENGDLLQFDGHTARMGEKVPVGRILIDGTLTGEVADEVLRDRRHLAEDGLVVPVIAINKQTGALEGVPEIITRGFVMEDSHALLADGARMLSEVMEQSSIEERTDPGLIKEKLRVELRRFLRKRSGRRPFVLPVIMEI